ncbi:MAG: ABC transporter substrate-binding protein [Oscillospiraceae bacterium]|nr:ABC transporter substrate-binding protein [Oscillospiraceae bacterium]
MKKTIALLLSLVMSFALCACSTSTHVTTSENIIIDGAGTALTIPENRSETTIASVYAVSVPFIVALGLSDRVVAVNVKSKFWTDNVPALAKADTVGRGVVDLEKLAQVSPDVLIHRSNDPKTVESVSALDINVLCITVENLEDIKNTLIIMGQYFGVSDRANEVCKWMDTKFSYIDSIVAEIPGNDRVSALAMGGDLGRIAGGDMLQSWMIEKAGGICVADSIEADHNWTDVGVETIFEWNPDYLFCTGSTALEYSVDSLYTDSSWSAVEAVKSRNVYRIPATYDAWDMPGISCVLGTMYMLREMYPDYFSAEELQTQIDEYYSFMFGKTFDADYLGYELES